MKKAMVICLAIMFCALAVSSAAKASGFSSVTITTDKKTYSAGETMHVVVEGTDSDSNPNDNYIDVSIYVINSTSYTEIYSDTGIQVRQRWTANIDIPFNVEGTGYVYVQDTKTQSLLGIQTFSVVAGGVVSGSLTLQESIYTKTLTFIPGETMHITVHDCTPFGNYTLKIMLGTNVKYERNLTVDGNGNYFLNYTIPESAPDSPRPDGTRYSVELYNGTTRIDRIRYDVKLYEIYVGLARNVYIPGEVVVVKYAVLYLKNSTPVADDLFGTWYVQTPSGTLLQESVSFRKSTGEFSFKLQNAAEPGYYTIFTYYNDSTVAEPDRWDMATTLIYCGNLGLYIFSPLNGNFVRAGEIVSISVKTYVARSGSGVDMGNLPDVSIKLGIKKGDETIFTKNFVTSYSGYLEYAWQVPENLAESTILEFNFTASKADAEISKSVTLTVTKPTTGVGISALAEFDKQSYLTGEEIKLHVKATYKDGSPGNFSYVYLVYRDAAHTNLMTMNTSSSPDFVYTPPDTFYGALYYYVRIADNMGNTTEISKTVSVDYALILLSAERTLYMPGDVLKFSYQILSKRMKNPECLVTVADNSGKVLKSMKVENGSFEIQIPDNPAEHYTVRFIAQENGVVVSDEITISRASLYEFTVSLSPSAYTTNVYRPGETIYLKYSLKVKENAPKPRSLKITIVFYSGAFSLFGSENAKIIETEELSGTIAYTIPSDLETGIYSISVECQINSTYYGTFYFSRPISVVKDPSGADLSVGGMRAMDLLLLVLVILAIVLCIAFFFILSRRMGAMVRGESKKKEPQSKETQPQAPQAQAQQPQPQYPPSQPPKPPQSPQPPGGTKF